MDVESWGFFFVSCQVMGQFLDINYSRYFLPFFWLEPRGGVTGLLEFIPP